MADGRLVMDTEIDVSGAKEGVKNLTSEQIKVRNEYRKTTREIALLEKQIKEMETPKIDTSSLEKFETKLRKACAEQAVLEAQQDKIADELAAGAAPGTSERRLQEIFENDRAWRELQQAIAEADIEIERYEEEIKKIKATTSTDIGTIKYKKAVDALANATERLDALGEKTKEVDAKQASLVQRMKCIGKEGQKNFDKASNSAKKFAVRLRSIIASAFIFNVISSGLRQLTTYMGNALKTNKQFSASMSAIKGNLLTAFQPIYNAIMPALNTLMAGLQKVTGYIASFISTLFGTSVKASQESAKELYEQSSALDSVADSAKKANKQLSDIDELQVLNNSENTDSTSGSTSSTIVPTFGEIEVSGELPEWLQNSMETIQKLISDWKIGDFFSVGEDVSDLVIQINEFLAKAISSVDWKNVGENVGAFLRGIKWLEVFKSIGDVISAAIDGAIDFWFGAFSEAPFETALITAMALWKLTGVGSFLTGKINNALGTSIPAEGFSLKSALKVIFELLLAFKIGDKIGSELAKLLDDEVADILGEDTFFDYVFKFGVSDGLKELESAFGEVLNEFMENFADMNNILNWNEIPLTSAVQELADTTNRLNIKFSKFQELAEKPLTIKAEYEEISGLLSTYFDLSKMDYNSMTDAQKTQLKTLYDKISEYAPEIVSKVDTVTGAWKGTSDELQEAVDNQYKFYLQSAYSEIYSEAIKNMTEYQSEYRKAYTNGEYQNLLKEKKEADSELESIRAKLLSNGFSIEDINQLNNGNILLGMDKNLAKQYITAYNNSRKINKNVYAIEESMQEISSYFDDTKKEALEIAKQMGIVDDELELMKVTDFITYEDFEKNIENAENVYNEAKDNIENNPAEAEINTDTSSVENAEWTWQDFLNEVEDNPAEGEAKVDTSPAINAVTTGVSVMNVGLGLIKTPSITAKTSLATTAVTNAVETANRTLETLKTPSVNIETSSALNKAETLRNSIETTLKGINIGLKVDIQAKIKDAMTAAINIGKSAKVGIGEIKTYNPPYLASGAVIPPNREFMAVLGDQKHGMNIEAPAELIKQMVTEGIKESGTTGDNDVNVYVYLEGDAEDVFRIVKVEHDKIKKQTGKSAFA